VISWLTLVGFGLAWIVISLISLGVLKVLMASSPLRPDYEGFDDNGRD
jgi:hypothetical protein